MKPRRSDYPFLFPFIPSANVSHEGNYFSILSLSRRKHETEASAVLLSEDFSDGRFKLLESFYNQLRRRSLVTLYSLYFSTSFFSLFQFTLITNKGGKCWFYRLLFWILPRRRIRSRWYLEKTCRNIKRKKFIPQRITLQLRRHFVAPQRDAERHRHAVQATLYRGRCRRIRTGLGGLHT